MWNKLLTGFNFKDHSVVCVSLPECMCRNPPINRAGVFFVMLVQILVLRTDIARSRTPDILKAYGIPCAMSLEEMKLTRGEESLVDHVKL